MRRHHPLAVIVALGLFMLAAVLFVPFAGAKATAATRQPIVQVGPPNGVDDTASLQAALNFCVGKGPNCVVQLSAGTYLTKQLVTYNFQGTFRGAGENATTIQALPGLSVVQRDFAYDGECMPNTTTCLWPSLIIFVDGQIRVSDLSIRIAALNGTATTGWTIFGLPVSTLLDAMRFMGQNPTDVTVDRVNIQGQPDDSPNSIWVQFGSSYGFNVLNGIHYAGELPRSTTPADYYFLSGSLTVRNSSFSTMVDGVSQDGFSTSSHITVGGSPSTGNRFDNLYVGIDLEDSQNSVFDISYNQVSAMAFGMWVTPWEPDNFTPNALSQYLIHNNTFQTTQPGGTGIWLDNEYANWINAAVWNNAIDLQNADPEFSTGISDYSASHARIVNNSITVSSGSALDAIDLDYGASSSTLAQNKLTGFGDASLGSIYLDPTTSKNNVICSSTSDTVTDQGTNNKVVGCN
jgi:hypothetical protein